jgi:CBS domain-containing protein
MHLATIMTPAPRFVAPETPLDDALTVMDSAYVRHLPVVSEAGRLVGLVSDRDLLEATGWLPSAQREETPGGIRRRLETVGQVMHVHVVTASPLDTVVTAAVDLVGRRIGCLPILRQDILVGIVTEMDVVGAYLRRVEALPLDDDANPAIDHVMTWNPATIPWDVTLAEARRLMRVDDIRHLPVVEEGRLVGMLSDRDLRRAYGAGRSKDAPVGEVMSRDVVSLGASARARDAAAAIVHNRISAVPVLDERSGLPVLIGIVTVTDLLDHSLGTLREESPVQAAV